MYRIAECLAAEKVGKFGKLLLIGQIKPSNLYLKCITLMAESVHSPNFFCQPVWLGNSPNIPAVQYSNSWVWNLTICYCCILPLFSMGFIEILVKQFSHFWWLKNKNLLSTTVPYMHTWLYCTCKHTHTHGYTYVKICICYVGIMYVLQYIACMGKTCKKCCKKRSLLSQSSSYLLAWLTQKQHKDLWYQRRPFYFKSLIFLWSEALLCWLLSTMPSTLGIQNLHLQKVFFFCSRNTIR